MTTPRAMARHVFYSQRPQGLRKTHAVMRGTGTAVVMVGSKEGNGVQDKRRGDEKGAAKGETAAMISRPPGRRPSQVLVDIGPGSSDRMMSIPPGRPPSQVMAVIMLTAKHDGGQVVRGSAPGRGEGGSGGKARSSGEGIGGGSKGNPPITNHGQMPEAATR